MTIALGIPSFPISYFSTALVGTKTVSLGIRWNFRYTRTSRHGVDTIGRNQSRVLFISSGFLQQAVPINILLILPLPIQTSFDPQGGILSPVIFQLMTANNLPLGNNKPMSSYGHKHHGSSSSVLPKKVQNITLEKN